MNKIQHFLTVLSLIAAITTAHGQSAATSSPKIEKDCINLSPQAKRECLKVAKQMDREATQPHQPAGRPDSANSPSPNTVQHSSPVMQTPEEIRANAKKPAPGSDTKPPK
jgi:hypothetical protein